jgi:TldD protein
MGVDFYDFRILRAQVTEISVENGEISHLISFSRVSGISRALVDGTWGIYSFEGEKSEEEAVRRAIELASSISKGRKYKLNEEISKFKEKLKPKKDPRDVDIEEKLELLRDSEKLLKDELMKSTRVYYSDFFLEMLYENSLGCESEYSLSKTGMSLSCVASRNGEIEIGYDSHFDLGGFEVVEKTHENLAFKAKEVALELLNAKMCPSGRFSVIMDPELTGVFVHEAVGHASEGDLVLEGSSKFAGMIGKEIASPLVSIVDDPRVRAFGYYPVDDEGVRVRRKVIIEEGVLKSYLNNRETSEELGGSPGNARAQWNSSPIVRMSNTFLLPGDMKKEEIFEGFSGLYLLGSRGGQVSTADGIFQFNAERGYLVEKGEIICPLKNASISGDMIELLKNVVAVCDDLQLNSGRCGKKNQTVSVSDGGPHVKLKEAIVG